MDKILVDTNIILDVALKRQPFVEQSSLLFLTALEKGVSLYVTATTITDLYYIIRKAKGHSVALMFIGNLLNFTEVAGVNRDVIVEALESRIADFEDAVQISAARNSSIPMLVTRNIKDFEGAPLKVSTPAIVLQELSEID